MKTLIKGTRIFNTGDMANDSHFGTVTEVKFSEWGTNYLITLDGESERNSSYWVSHMSFSPVYKGHCGTRFVTEEAYNAFKS